MGQAEERARLSHYKHLKNECQTLSTYLRIESPLLFLWGLSAPEMKSFLPNAAGVGCCPPSLVALCLADSREGVVSAFPAELSIASLEREKERGPPCTQKRGGASCAFLKKKLFYLFSAGTFRPRTKINPSFHPKTWERRTQLRLIIMAHLCAPLHETTLSCVSVIYPMPTTTTGYLRATGYRK